VGKSHHLHWLVGVHLAYIAVFPAIELCKERYSVLLNIADLLHGLFLVALPLLAGFVPVLFAADVSHYRDRYILVNRQRDIFIQIEASYLYRYSVIFG
jgi:hypothetical protein